MRRFRRVRGRRVLVAGAWVLCGVMLSCPVPFCPALPRPAPSGKPPFSAFPRFAVWRNALLGMSSAGARRTAREPAPIGGGSRTRPRSRARRPAPRPPVPASPPRTATSRTRKTANADNRRFRGSRPFAREGPGAWGSGLADWAGMTVARGRISHLPSAEKNTPLGECPQLTVSF